MTNVIQMKIVEQWVAFQPVVHLLWSLGALALLIVSLVEDAYSTLIHFSYWNIAMHFVIYLLLAIYLPETW